MIKILKTVCCLRHSTLFLFLLITISGFSQVTQSVSGIVTDDFSKPLSSATVQLIGSDSTVVTAAQADGRFTVVVFPGRFLIRISYQGYAPVEEELLVIAGKASTLKFTLREAPQQLTDVEITSGGTQSAAGSYAISIEKTMRMPANFFDPVRMATSLPGVVATNDQANSISIKGYTPNAMLWRLNGLDIVNPNHLANAGTLSDRPVANGGGVSILSSQVLDKTDFYTGYLPAQYGNALSGVMDMTMRPGSKTSREHTVQASLIGIDLATEGPMGKRDGGSPLGGQGAARASYLVNYRYSTVGLLSQAGVNFGDEAINFQDLTFNLDFNQKKGGNLSVFGFGGLSSNKFNRKPQDEWETEKDRYDIDFTAKTFGIGTIGTVPIKNQSMLKWGLTYSGQNQERQSQSETITTPDYYIFRESFESNRSIASTSLSYHTKFGKTVNVNGGVVVSAMQQEFFVETITQNPINDLWPNLNGEVNGVLWQPYVSTTFNIKNLEVQTGLRYVHFDYNQSSAWSPTAQFAHPLAGGKVAVSYALASQIQQTQTYLSVGNKPLELTKAHQWMLSYEKSIQNLIVNVKAYHHVLFDVPISGSTIPFSTLNQINELAPDNLSSNGIGFNTGLEATIEKKFSDKFYWLLAGSWYSSKFGRDQSQLYDARFNGRFTISGTGGKEWALRKGKVFGINLRLLYLGGLRQQAINIVESQQLGDTRYINPNIFLTKLPDYFRPDLRVSWRKNKPGYTRTISLDIQNLTNQQNQAYWYYDTFLQKVEKKNQLGLIPVLVYRVDF